jgi:putative hydrolase of the HAD superfamily
MADLRGPVASDGGSLPTVVRLDYSAPVGRAILFDLFNTLLPGGDSTGTTTNHDVAVALGVDGEKFEALMAETWRERMTGGLGDLTAQLTEVARRLGGEPSDAQVAAAVEVRLAYARGQMVPESATLDVITGLRGAGWAVAVVSNCTVDSATAFADSPLAPLADAAVLSCEARLAKPDPRIYERTCKELGAEPLSCVYVGDGADRELYGAWALGMRVVQTRQYAQSDPDWSGPKITNLSELPAYLDKLPAEDPSLLER